MSGSIKSYTSVESERAGWWSEFRTLARSARLASKQVSEDARRQIALCDLARQMYQQSAGKPLSGAKLMEVGCGQMLAAARVFGVDNTVLATDLDVFAAGWNPSGYLRIWRQNGLKRMIKTIGRKALRRDSSFLEALRQELGVARLPQPEARQMDATRMDLADNSFDLAYSYSVFEHLPEPEAVWREQMRVVKPDGYVFTHLHLFTSDSGGHDLRVIARNREGVPYWAHLRPQHQGVVQNSAYLNRVRLADWMKLIERTQPGAEVTFVRDDDLVEEMARVRAAGELSEYSDDELLTRNIVVFWKKPTA